MKSQSSNRSFGILFFIVFLILSLWPLKNGSNLNFYFLIFAGIFLVLGALNSNVLTPFNRLWVKFGEILGKLIAPIIMGLVYFLILTPISLTIRLFRKDLLGLKFNKSIKTYWIERKNKLSSMSKQF